MTMSERFFTRRDKVRRRLAKLRIDALLITHPVNVRYLSGFTGGDSLLIVRRSGDDVLLSDPRFTIQIGEECPGLEAYIRPGGEMIPSALAKILGKSTLRTKASLCGVEAESMTLADRIRFFQQLSNWEMIPTQGIVEEFRQIKDRSEIMLIRKAIDVAYRAFLDARRRLCNGLELKKGSKFSEIDFRNDLEYRMRLHGAEEKSFPSIVGAGSRAALPHGVPSSTTIAGKSHLLIDWGAIVDGYMSDLTRVLILSPGNRKLRNIYETVLKAQTAAIKAVKPGKSGQEIDAVARAVIRDAGYGNAFNHGLGHALGLEIHEAPRLAIGHDTILKPGMVVTVEPGIYLKDWGGVRIEDDVLVTKTGCEILSRQVPKSFDEMTV